MNRSVEAGEGNTRNPAENLSRPPSGEIYVTGRSGFQLPPTLGVTLNSDPNWSLHRKGEADQARHKAKIREAIRENLPEIVSEESVITSSGDKIVKVPIKSLELPRFRYNPGKQDHVGQGSGGSKVGDVVGQEPGQAGQGKGKGAGHESGQDVYEAEITVDELAAMVFQDLGLPNLRPTAQREIEVPDPKFKYIGKSGIMGNLHRKKTLIENIKRNARNGDPRFFRLKQEDMRFRIWDPDIRRESNAVILAMRDVSASMGEFEKYISRSFYWWMTRFLRTQYNTVNIRFITHHTDAKEVDEDTFFKLGESGGTRVSSAYQLALDMVHADYPPSQWNVYPFHFSDGDNWGEADNRRCLELVGELLKVSNQFGYGEIRESRMSQLSTLMSAFKGITDPKFVGVTINDKKEVYPALKRFFSITGGSPEGGGLRAA